MAWSRLPKSAGRRAVLGAVEERVAALAAALRAPPLGSPCHPREGEDVQAIDERSPYVGVVHSGRIMITHEDGTELELGPGEAYVIEPGHDAWVVGDEKFVGYEFEPRSAEE